MASSTAEPSGSSRSRYSAIPSSSYGWDRAVPCLSRSSRRWNSPRWPYFAINAGRSARIWRGPCPSARVTNPASTVSWHSGVSRDRSLSISPIATAALRTGARAASTASRSTRLRSWLIATVTATRPAAPPAT